MNTIKVVINVVYGGFLMSDEAEKEYMKRKGLDEVDYYNLARDDPDLIDVIEEFGERADTSFSRLKVVNIPEDVEWIIQEYDGAEWVAEKHRTWS